MTEEQLKQGRWQGKIETTQESHSKRITRLEVALISMVVFMAMRSADRIMEVAGI
jgi:hypothetical protein